MQLPSNTSGTNIVGSGGAFPPSSVVGDFQVNLIKAVQGAVLTNSLQSNPDRVALYFPNAISSGTFYFAFRQTSQTQEMSTPGSPSNPMVLTFRDLGALITLPVWTFYNGFGTDYYFWEVVYLPKGGV